MTAADTSTEDASSVLPVRDAARTFERDRYLAALLAPKDVREDLVAVAAFIGEVKRVPLQTHDGTIGEIRLQWWRDAFGDAHSASGHPVADAMKDVMRRRRLDVAAVTALIDGFSREHYEDGIRDEEELVAYADETDGIAIRLALGVLAAEPDEDLVRLASQAGTALALARLAVSLPIHLSHGRLPLPQSLVEEIGDPRGREPEAAAAVLSALTARIGQSALDALAAFRAIEGSLGKGQISAFLPVCLVGPYVAAAMKPGRDVLRQAADISPLSRVTRLWFAHVSGRL